MKNEKKETGSEPATVVNSFRLPRETWKAIRIRAIQEDRKYIDVIAQALEEYCRKPLKTSGGAA